MKVEWKEISYIDEQNDFFPIKCEIWLFTPYVISVQGFPGMKLQK